MKKKRKDDIYGEKLTQNERKPFKKSRPTNRKFPFSTVRVYIGKVAVSDTLSSGRFQRTSTFYLSNP
jgi:hypothetical protein